MDKMRMESVDITAQNIEKIGAMFPNCITETIDESGKPKKAINFGLLKQVLSGNVLDGDEAYEFTWVGKNAAIVETNKPIRKTFRPCVEESKDWDTTENLYIEGDNLEVLKLLQESYLGAVKMIYIDPPYNTRNDFIYNDDFKISNEEYAGELGAADEDGFIFISIDEEEIENLYEICNEVFGKPRHMGTFIWKQRQMVDSRSKTGVSEDHEYMLCYVKAADKRIRGAVADMTRLATASQRPNLHYEIMNPHTGIVYACPPLGWRYNRKHMDELIANEEVIWPANKAGRSRRKKFVKDLQSIYTGFSTVLDTIYNTQATRELKVMFEGEDYFDFPKPTVTDVYYAADEYDQDMLSTLESNVKPDRTDLDLLFSCLLEWGLSLSMPYKSEQIENCIVHTYNDGDLIACFNENVPDSVVKKTIANRQPLRAVFHDSSFANSPAKINVTEIFKLLAPDTRVKVI